MSDVTILCTDIAHPVNPYLRGWIAEHGERHHISLLHRADEVTEGEFLFLISCAEIIPSDLRARFRHALVIHASDLPKGRGWSPHIWSILRGDDHLTVSLLVADDPPDSGAIFARETVPLKGTELYDEVHRKLFEAELRLMTWALDHCDCAVPTAQTGAPTYWRRRTPADSRVAPEASFAEAFDLLRVADPERYPAFLEHRGQHYLIRLERAPSDLLSGKK
jgi:methionyl-tRNA formyltransferase